ncbi:unnamed protein product [Allacma fusca]|uniref:Uncharacterized protein n=1 Tax=Allacma fusca TaxID=39272 RepID=A0A8J2JNI7_9HEXA|nr:unnamed protein product [Allacma fusca]
MQIKAQAVRIMRILENTLTSLLPECEHDISISNLCGLEGANDVTYGALGSTYSTASVLIVSGCCDGMECTN